VISLQKYLTVPYSRFFLWWCEMIKWLRHEMKWGEWRRHCDGALGHRRIICFLLAVDLTLVKLWMGVGATVRGWSQGSAPTLSMCSLKERLWGQARGTRRNADQHLATHLYGPYPCNHTSLNGAKLWKTATWDLMKPQCMFIINPLDSEISFSIPFAPSTKFLANPT